MRNKLFILILFVMLCVGRAEARGAFDPAHTWVYAVGVLQWQAKDLTSFTPKDCKDAQVVAEFRKAGVPADHIVYLQDKAATLAAIQSTMPALLDRSAPGDLLVFYYAGHGYRFDAGKCYFANYDAGETPDTTWAVDSIVQTVDRHFHGSRALLLVDCCNSGALAEAVEHGSHKIAYAVMTSASSHEESTGNWTFTMAILDALKGEGRVDANGDGTVDLDELGAYALDDMALFEWQKAVYVKSAGFDGHMALSSAGPRPVKPRGNRVEAVEDGKWYNARITDAKPGQVKIRWMLIGYDSQAEEEWISVDRLRTLSSKEWPIGAHVEVLSDGKWYGARILKVERGAHLVHYDKYTSEWDEWVTPSKIRKPE